MQSRGGVRPGGSGRRPVDLANLNTGPINHHLYVIVVGANPQTPSDKQSRVTTLQILQFISQRLKIFTEMGVKVNVLKISKKLLSDPRLVAAMKGKGITRLPALKTPNAVYLGREAIEGVYTSNIQEYQAWKRREVEKPVGLSGEDELDDFYRSEMSFDRAFAEEDMGDEENIGEGGDMMKSYSSALAAREGRGSRPSGSLRGSHPPPSQGNPQRSDNVPTASSEDSMDDLINQLSGQIDSQTFEQAFAGSGGDSLDDDGLDGGGNAQDDLMERAYWANQQESM